MFAGWDGVYMNDTWQLDLSGTPTWAQLAPTGTPPTVRSLHGAVLDAPRDRMIVVGGSSTAAPGTFNDVWQLSLGGTPAWTQLAPLGTPPTAGIMTATAHDPLRQRLLVFGPGTSGRNDVLALSLAGPATWSTLAPQGYLPCPRAWCEAEYDPVHDRMITFGTYSSSSTLNDTWSLEFGNDAVAVEPAAPPARDTHLSITPNPGARFDVRFAIPSAGATRVTVYDVFGRKVQRLVDGTLEPGTHRAVWDGRDGRGERAKPGLYFCELARDGQRHTRTFVVIE